MEILFDARALRLYPVAQPGFSGGTELMVRELAHGLAGIGHTVHIVAPDLDRMQQRGATEYWWGPDAFPKVVDAVVAVHSLHPVMDANYQADYLLFATNGIDPDLGPAHEWGAVPDAFPVFSQCHADLMRKARPTIPADRCHVTGLGVDLADYDPPNDGSRVPGRLLYANAPERGLYHLLDVFDRLVPLVPHATLHVAYDFERQFTPRQWDASHLSQLLWECKRRIETTAGVVSVGGLDRAGIIREQRACQVHAMPSDPPNRGSQIHGLSQGECAAAGSALVLSDTEAFSEVFDGAAIILPLPGTYLPQHGRRYDAQDWAEAIAELMSDEAKWQDASTRARAWAERNTWSAVVDRWDALLRSLQMPPSLPQDDHADRLEGDAVLSG